MLDSYNFLQGICSNLVFVGIWLGIFVVQVSLGTYGGVFFSVYKYGLSYEQWAWVFSVSLVVIPISLLTKFVIFKVFKLGNGENELEAATEDEAIRERKKSHNVSRNNISKISES